MNGTGGGNLDVDAETFWSFNAFCLLRMSGLFSWSCIKRSFLAEAELLIFLTAVPERTLSNAVWLKLAFIRGDRRFFWKRPTLGLLTTFPFSE